MSNDPAFSPASLLANLKAAQARKEATPVAEHSEPIDEPQADLPPTDETQQEAATDAVQEQESEQEQPEAGEQEDEQPETVEGEFASFDVVDLGTFEVPQALVDAIKSTVEVKETDPAPELLKERETLVAQQAELTQFAQMLYSGGMDENVLLNQVNKGEITPDQFNRAMIEMKTKQRDFAQMQQALASQQQELHNKQLEQRDIALSQPDGIKGWHKKEVREAVMSRVTAEAVKRGWDAKQVESWPDARSFKLMNDHLIALDRIAELEAQTKQRKRANVTRMIPNGRASSPAKTAESSAAKRTQARVSRLIETGNTSPGALLDAMKR